MTTFRRHPEAEERRRSAIRAAKAILGVDLYPLHKRQLLRVTLWKLTEADGDHKYRTRYRTEGALASTELQHDHVIQQASLLDALCAYPESADELLNCAIACTVSVPEHERLTEHSRLNPQIDGWARYDELNLAVIDTYSGERANLKELAEAYDHPLLRQTRATARRLGTWRQLFDELNIHYNISGRRIADSSPLRYKDKSLHVYFHDRARKAPSFSAHEEFYSEFSWNGWDVASGVAVRGYLQITPECDFERNALVAMLEYAFRAWDRSR